MPGPTVFIGYSPSDRVWKDRLVKHLKVVGGEGWFEVWDETMIQGGANREATIGQAMGRAKLAVLLISADFLVSDPLRYQMVTPLIERRSRDGLIVLPVIVRTCKWKRVDWISGIQVRPPGSAVAARRGDAIDRVMADIADEVFELIRSGTPAPELIPAPRENVQLQAWFGTLA